MDAEFKGKVVIVTGAAGGIGSACAEACAHRGAKTVLVDVARERLNALCERLGGQPGSEPALPLTLDVASEDDMTRMVQATLEEFGRIDALVAAAGILRTGGEPRTIADTPFEEWTRVIAVNLTGTFLSNRAVLPALIAQGEGDIVNISSTSGKQGRAFDGPYCASKSGIVGLSESLAEEVSRLGVRVQTVIPDAVDTPLWEQSGAVALKPKLFLTPERVAEFVVYLLGLPRDTYLLNPMLFPMKLRSRRKREK